MMQQTSGSPSARAYYSTLKPLIRLIWTSSPWLFVTSLCINALNGAIPTANILITSTLLDLLVQAARQPASQQTLPGNFLWWLLLFGMVTILSQVLQQLTFAVQSLHQTRVTNHICLLVAEKGASIDLSCFENSEFHNEMQTASNEAAYRPLTFISLLTQLVSEITTIVSLSIMVIWWQPWIVPLIALASLARLRISTRFGTAWVALTTGRAEVERRKFYLRTLLTSEQAAKEIRLFSLQHFLLTKFRSLLETTFQQDRQFILRKLWYVGMVDALVSALQPILYGFTAVQAFFGYISIGAFSFYIQSISQIQTKITSLMSSLSTMHESNLFIMNLLTFLAMKPGVEASGSAGPDHQSALLSTPHIEFRNVTFCYPGKSQPVLKDMSFVIQPGESVALVGENGAGKTTLVKLLAGLYEPTQGQILVDHIDIQAIPRDDLRRLLSVVFQDFNIYHLSASENIGIGQVDRVDDQQRIEMAAQLCGLDQVICQLPQQYETVLGRFWTSGHELSGGQRQLVALARAIMRPAPILILDEPSAALDIFAEQRFFQHLLEGNPAHQPRTVIFISHRFATVRRADRIFVLEHGQLLEQGTHDELLSLGRIYAQMFALQAKPYASSQTSTPLVEKAA